MKHPLSTIILSTCLALATFVQGESKKPVYRDAETHVQIAKKLKVSNSHNPMKTLLPSEGEDPSVKNRPQDIISSSDVLSFGGLTTLVPKKAIMRIPEIYADRINNHVPGNRIVGWFEFYRLNRAWITPVEVSRIQAEGKEPIAEEVSENLKKNQNLIIATYSASPISLLELKVQEEETPESTEP
ncbi:hypothetical protein [Luteolibacter sp. AS25]|uniref:hypothetical protein n=1 Tax=Luteolibacter sp. AS25 TaxID=3135776 RepID=UPI00398A7612